MMENIVLAKLKKEYAERILRDQYKYTWDKEHDYDVILTIARIESELELEQYEMAKTAVTAALNDAQGNDSDPCLMEKDLPFEVSDEELFGGDAVEEEEE